MKPVNKRSVNLTGRWIGETQGCETQSHHWVIVQRGIFLDIYTRWESEAALMFFGCCWKMPDGQPLVIPTADGAYQAEMQDANTFLIYNWVGNTYNALFRRKDTGVKRIYYQVLLNVLITMRNRNLRRSMKGILLVDPISRFVR